MLRKPVVSGQFYPSDPGELAGLINELAPGGFPKRVARAIVLPHAGYRYSARVALATLARVLPKKRIIIVGPKHTDLGCDFSLVKEGAWEIPFGQIPIDEELAASIMTNATLIREDTRAHEREHSIEVQLPLIHHCFGSFTFVPIACQRASIKTYQAVAAEIYEGIKTLPDEVLLVASSDMTHYEPEARARAQDRLALEYIVKLDAEGLVGCVRRENISMCGVAPVAIVIECAKRIGARKANIALYQTSGDSSGDYNSVVGYAGIVMSS
ncbi:MAG: AmmeMemoRadiSam system protein B [Candidatus Omnitrophota bacterium]|nr:AmmeMemoRadiSam system protein B [Candidatus Omnitrophota bacterium]